MTDIFEQKILCKRCNVQMKPTIVNRNGFELRAIECPRCKEKIIHPADLNGMDKFKDIKGKNFHVKLRIVGNSHAISIPKEIIDFMNEQRKMMRRSFDDMVNLHFDDIGKLSVDFWNNFDEDDDDNGNNRTNEFESEGEADFDYEDEEDEIKIHRIKPKRLRRRGFN